MCRTFDNTVEDPSVSCRIIPAPSLFADPSSPSARYGLSVIELSQKLRARHRVPAPGLGSGDLRVLVGIASADRVSTAEHPFGSSRKDSGSFLSLTITFSNESAQAPTNTQAFIHKAPARQVDWQEEWGQRAMGPMRSRSDTPGFTITHKKAMEQPFRAHIRVAQ